ncbi:MAG: hypothetical protein ACI845_000845 [Gammaproteobacteria bacterium]|jgi:hypothetical protein
MKKYFTSSITTRLVTIILVTNFSIFYFGLSYADMSLIGEWAGTDSDGDTATFIFNDDKSAELQMEGLPPLSSRNLTNGRVTWDGDKDHNRIKLDFVIHIGLEEKRRIKMLAHFIDDKTLKIQMSRDMKTRPEGFEVTKSVFQIITTKQ